MRESVVPAKFHQLIFSFDAQICTAILFLFLFLRTRAVASIRTVIRTDILHSAAPSQKRVVQCVGEVHELGGVDDREERHGTLRIV